MPEHSTLTGADLHEPKGADTAAVGEIYIADGLGSGTWQKSATTVHGEMIINANATPEVTPTAVDTTLSTDSDYTKIITGWTSGQVSEVTFNVDELVVPVAGDYEIHAWADISCPANNQRVGMKFAINDTTPYSTRKLITTSAAAGDIVNIAGAAFTGVLAASDTISLYIATDKAGDPTVLEAGLLIKLLHEI